MITFNKVIWVYIQNQFIRLFCWRLWCIVSVRPVVSITALAWRQAVLEHLIRVYWYIRKPRVYSRTCCNSVWTQLFWEAACQQWERPAVSDSLIKKWYLLCAILVYLIQYLPCRCFIFCSIWSFCHSFLGLFDFQHVSSTCLIYFSRGSKFIALQLVRWRFHYWTPPLHWFLCMASRPPLGSCAERVASLASLHHTALNAAWFRACACRNDTDSTVSCTHVGRLQSITYLTWTVRTWLLALRLHISSPLRCNIMYVLYTFG